MENYTDSELLDWLLSILNIYKIKTCGSVGMYTIACLYLDVPKVTFTATTSFIDQLIARKYDISSLPSIEDGFKNDTDKNIKI